MHWTSLAPTVLAAFAASMVEFVEALTIVLAVGTVRGWRSTLLGTGTAVVVLLALVAVLGPSLAHVPLQVARLAVGTLLLLFGLRWLRKAVLRAAGVLALHDEAQAFATETAALRGVGGVARKGIDKAAFGTSFKIVMLEGMEVVFIVIAIGAGGPLIVPASIGAGLALLVVVALGFALRRPLAAIPENTLKFGVGVLLSAFGSFWVGEGIGLPWPGGDWAILGWIGTYLAAGLALVALCARLHRRPMGATHSARKASLAPAPGRGPVGRIASGLWGLFVDDVRLAVGVVVLVVAAWAMQARSTIPMPWLCLILAMGLNIVLALSAARSSIGGRQHDVS